MPVLRVTCSLRENEDRLLGFMQELAADILRALGATRTWPTLRFKGVMSSHELGGCRMGGDPATTVVDRDLTIRALAARAADRLVARLTDGSAG